jgi:branched-subunit amino acid aminotransferase/4-amino-4-deoxychorismate lyase
VIVSPTETRSATSLLSRCKSFAYGASIQARRQALQAGADDALLNSSAGGLCCGTSANLLVCRGGSWITPPLSSGCLPGVMRQRGLDRGLINEAPVNEADLQTSAAALLLNSLGCRPISHLGARPIANPAPSGCGSQEAETFWRQLLQASP